MIYQPYPHPNRALVRAIYHALREGVISRVAFVAGIKMIMGKHRED